MPDSVGIYKEEEEKKSYSKINKVKMKLATRAWRSLPFADDCVRQEHGRIVQWQLVVRAFVSSYTVRQKRGEVSAGVWHWRTWNGFDLQTSAFARTFTTRADFPLVKTVRQIGKTCHIRRDSQWFHSHRQDFRQKNSCKIYRINWPGLNSSPTEVRFINCQQKNAEFRKFVR